MEPPTPWTRSRACLRRHDAFPVLESGTNSIVLAVTSTPLTVRFTDRSSGSVTGRLWAFGDGQSSTEQNPVHTYGAAGLYTAKLTVYGAGGQNSKWEITIDVKAAGSGEPPGHNLYLPAVRR